MDYPLPLDGLNGSNPLAFLAALGVLSLVHDDDSALAPRLGWTPRGAWRPVLHTVTPLSAIELSARLAEKLKGKAVDPAAESTLKKADKARQLAKKAVKDKQEEIKGRRLGREDAALAVEEEIVPLQSDFDEKHRVWLGALELAAVSPELAIGKDLSVPHKSFRDFAKQFAAQATTTDRATVDLTAAFGSDACYDEKSGRIEATPFCFVTGSGWQFFLETVGKLMREVDAARIEATLCQPWRYEDEKLSMRWDPIEDRRYAMMWADPTSAGNEAKTVWAANLLAYHGLKLLPSAPQIRHLATTGFRREKRQLAFTWPIWETPVALDTVRSLLALSALNGDKSDDNKPDRAHLAARGIEEVMRCERIQVGTPPLHKINFTPAQPV